MRIKEEALQRQGEAQEALEVARALKKRPLQRHGEAQEAGGRAFHALLKPMGGVFATSHPTVSRINDAASTNSPFIGA